MQNLINSLKSGTWYVTISVLRMNTQNFRYRLLLEMCDDRDYLFISDLMRGFINISSRFLKTISLNY